MPAAVTSDSEFLGRCSELLDAAAVSTALAMASRTGLLAAMLVDVTPKTASQWASLAGVPVKNASDVLNTLANGQVIVSSCSDVEETTYCIPASRVSQVKEMGAIFEALLLRRMDPETTFNMVRFRSEKMSSCKLPPLPAVGS
eukprot:764497-Hanusia_phi.AAC.7